MHLWCSYLLILLLLVFVSVQGQNPSSAGFINIDCGITSNTSYVHSFTGLTYVSDDQYTDTGLNGKISSKYPVNKTMYTDLETLRSFPEGTRNCYTLTPVRNGSEYLVRALFYYGNYDGLEQSPSFDLYFGVNFWSTISIPEPGYWYYEEIVAVATANYMHVCLVNTGHGNPFISTLELRPLPRTLYSFAWDTQFIKLYARVDVGSDNSVVMRYPYDNYDRLWFNYTKSSWQKISTSSSVNSSSSIFSYEVPSSVLQTAAVPSTESSIIDITWSTSNKSTMFYVILHFAEIQIVQNTSLREFYIYANGKQELKNPVSIKYLNQYSYYYLDIGQTFYNMSLQSSPNATLPPILNAFELYSLESATLLPTDTRDVSAIKSIKTNYSIRKDWSGDPCLPTNYSWTGISCIIYASDIPRITVLNLSSSQLTGAIISAFGSLSNLQTLDLSRNNLSGNIPNSLDQLTSLTFLDLSGNSGLSGILPPGLQKKKNDHHLIVLTDSSNSSNSSNSTESGSGHKISSKLIFIIVAVVIVLLIAGAGAFFFCYKKKKSTRTDPPKFDQDPRTIGAEYSSHVLDDPKDTGESRARGKQLNFDKKQFSFAELKLVTNDFREKIGIGGFGEVFKGRLENGNHVAIKVRSELSSQGTQQFMNEVEKLSRVHHKNLVSLVGYCSDENHIALIYEYMEQGNLQDRLTGRAQPLSWKQRLRIAYESAQGLEYLHKMCNPPLIHRDVKTSNILLTRNLMAQVSDFGLVRTFSGTHVSTKVVGTPGYLDPHYASTSQLIERSDVYSFGVVLLEIVTGKMPICQGPQGNEHLTKFVQKKISKGNIESILDPYMGGQYNINSIWKVAELALRCTDLPVKRPDMTQVVAELKESLSLEMSHTETVSEASGDISSDYQSSPRDNLEMGYIRGSKLPDYGPLVR